MKEKINDLEKHAIKYMVLSGCKDRNVIYQLANNPDKYNKLTTNSKAVTVSRWFNRPDIQEQIKIEIYNHEKQKKEFVNNILDNETKESTLQPETKQAINQVNFLDRDQFLEFLNNRANEITDDKLRNDILKMLSDNLRYKDGENDENNEIQRFYTPLLCKDCQLYKNELDKIK